MEKQFLKSQLTIFRDAMVGKVPILLRDERGDEIPKMQMPMRPVVQPPISGMIAASGSVIAPPSPTPPIAPAVVVKLDDKPEGSTC